MTTQAKHKTGGSHFQLLSHFYDGLKGHCATQVAERKPTILTFEILQELLVPGSYKQPHSRFSLCDQNGKQRQIRNAEERRERAAAKF